MVLVVWCNNLLTVSNIYHCRSNTVPITPQPVRKNIKTLKHSASVSCKHDFFFFFNWKVKDSIGIFFRQVGVLPGVTRQQLGKPGGFRYWVVSFLLYTAFVCLCFCLLA